MPKKQKPQDSPILRDVSNSRKFEYAKGVVSLNFTLGIDDQKDVKDFRELLNQALMDVNDLLDDK